MAFNNIHHKTRKSVEKGKEEGGKTKKAGLDTFIASKEIVILRSHRKISPKMKPNKLSQQDILATNHLLPTPCTFKKGKDTQCSFLKPEGVWLYQPPFLVNCA
jgi:hypothetical protein